jgi:hypothetical protein
MAKKISFQLVSLEEVKKRVEEYSQAEQVSGSAEGNKNKPLQQASELRKPKNGAKGKDGKV